MVVLHGSATGMVPDQNVLGIRHVDVDLHHIESYYYCSTTVPQTFSSRTMDFLKNTWYILPFLVVRLTATFFSQIPDCDEVFNYWEPLHYLLYGSGLQTWEYSPSFALRTYAYPLLHALPAVLAESVLGLTSRISIFYAVRTVLALLCCSAEIFFVRAVQRKYGTRVATFTTIFLLFSPGMFLSSPTFLPSTFVMLALTISMAAWFDHSYGLALAAATIGTFLSCWPYVAVSFVPLGLDALARRNAFAVIGWCLVLLIIIILPMLAIDAHYYGYMSFTPWNIILYNVVENKAELYGVESWTYYPFNLILNFSVAFPLSLFSFFVPMYRAAGSWWYGDGRRRCRGGGGGGGGGGSYGDSIMHRSVELAVHLAPLYVWALVMQTRPHKEERFLYFVYTLICFSAAVTLDFAADLVAQCLCGGGSSSGNSSGSSGSGSADISVNAGESKEGKDKKNAEGSSTCYWLLSSLALLPFLLLSTSRIINVVKNYRGPMEIYSHLYTTELPKTHGALSRFHLYKDPNAHDERHHDMPKLRYTEDYYNEDVDKGDHVAVCVGKEWYRYPSSFFLRPWSRVYFLRSGFTGQLPRAYEEHEHGTRVQVDTFNDNNLEETDRYVDLNFCHYVVDVDFGPGTESDRDPR